ncbi:MAG: hypothetical protein Kow0079_03650 [Vicingaceae bacterium]
MKELTPNTVESSELVEQTFNFWFKDTDHIRSPFPEYIRPQLKELAVNKFFDWASNLNPKAKDEINDTIIAEKFEEIIFEIASQLVLTDDEKITIQFPFLPRIGDEIYEDIENYKGVSIIEDRAILKEGDKQFLKVKCVKKENNETWETKFELPL